MAYDLLPPICLTACGIGALMATPWAMRHNTLFGIGLSLIAALIGYCFVIYRFAPFVWTNTFVWNLRVQRSLRQLDATRRTPALTAGGNLDLILSACRARTAYDLGQGPEPRASVYTYHWWDVAACSQVTDAALAEALEHDPFYAACAAWSNVHISLARLPFLEAPPGHDFPGRHARAVRSDALRRWRRAELEELCDGNGSVAAITTQLIGDGWVGTVGDAVAAAHALNAAR